MYFHKDHSPAKSWRFKAVLLVLLCCALLLVGRIVYLSVFNQAFLKTQGDIRALRVVAIPAYRGMITDRNGYPLAISTPVSAVWLDPSLFDAEHPQLITLAKLLGMPVNAIIDRAKKNAQREFVYLKRGLDPMLGKQIRDLAVPGISVQQEYKRFYPEGEVTAHLLGFTNIDDQGQEGIELAYNNWLAGVTGRKQVLKDRLGRTVADIQTVKQAEPGHNLSLSIDRRMQFLAYQALAEGVTKFKAVSGSAIILDVKTGEVLAMVNVPSYNPNHRTEGHDAYRNRAVTDLYEPGSVMKTVSMASALASGQFHANSKVDTSPGFMTVAGHRVEDEHDNGVIDMATLLAKSSNVGMTKITLSLPPDQLWQTFHLFGFGQVTNSNFPGESAGVLRRENPWRLFDLATMSFGYGMSATPLQVAAAYAVLGNGGVKLPISLLRQDTVPQGQRIISAKVARDLLDLLEAVIYQHGGTAPLAKVPGYRVTGKTGTSRLLGPHGGYLKHRYNGAFVGLAPAANPRLLVYVQIHDPQGSVYYGGYTAGPVFSKIMGNSLRLLGILPDDASPDTAPPPISQALQDASSGVVNDF